MELIADIFLIFGAVAATVYCIVLSRRLRRFTDLEKGVGGAIAVLSVQVDDMTTTLGAAQKSAVGSVQSLDGLTSKAESVARRLELLVASMHDIPEKKEEPSQPPEHQVEPEDSVGPVFLSQRHLVREAAE